MTGIFYFKMYLELRLHMGKNMNILKKAFAQLTAKPKIRIAAYRSYGTQTHLYQLGRALDDDELKIQEEQSFFRTLRNTYKQFDTDEIPNVEIELQMPDGSVLTTKTNRDGYFLFDIATAVNLETFANEEGWVPLKLSFKKEVKDTIISSDNLFKTELLIPPETAEFGVISDIDDTILHTGVTSFLKWRVLHNSLFKNAYDRISLEGAPKFYLDLHLGKKGNEQNPVFYLSNSPWNLYEYLKLFLEFNDFPRGPILLRDFRSPFDRSLKPEKPHKQKEILNILKTYPLLNFILIGDSGEHDPRIYTDMAVQFPDRILAIYLRSVKHKRRMQQVQSIVDNFKTVPVLSVKDSKEAEEHARQQGFIS